ncbi:hypothetical protein KA005_09140 [bacterium]|nr:hypothetical protein [bacterium]
MEKITASKILFIKLGHSGEWERECIETENTLRLGFRETDHDACLRGNWDVVRTSLIDNKDIDPGTATRYVNQIEAFYTSDSNILWITFYNNKMWWCFADEVITQDSDNTKYRKVRGMWSDQDIKGNHLGTDRLSGNLLKTQGFRGTICNVSLIDYVLLKINGEELPEIRSTKESLASLENHIAGLIKHLDWQDFELLIDLLFASSGWKRIGRLGKTEKTLDLDLVAPITNEKIIVQIKSSSSLDEYLQYVDKFNTMNDYDRMFYVVHSPHDKLAEVEKLPNVELLDVSSVANLAVKAGLVDWVIGKAS